MLKVVIDCNWYVSAAINAKSRKILHDVLTHPTIEVYYSDKLIEEFIEVIHRDKFKKYLTVKQAADFLKVVLTQMNEVATTNNSQLSRDPKDNYLLDICASCKADFLVTGDTDLLVLSKIGKTKIVTMATFTDEI